MSGQPHYLAFDLGAESGRAILAGFDGDGIQLSDVHRFSNGPVYLPDGIHWDVLHLWAEMNRGLGLAVEECGAGLTSLGVDTWAVDFGLLDRQGALISNPYHYRDSRTDSMLKEAFSRMSRAEIFERTGIQFLQINTLYQLLSMVVNHSPELGIADTLLTIPDLFNYWFTGQAVCEYTNATTTQCYNPRTEAWDRPLLDRMGISPDLFPDVVPPATVLGPLSSSVRQRLALASDVDVSVIAPACHDTGAAVAAVPADGPGFAWISSGTWSVAGAEVSEPVINEQSLDHNFTNEGGVCDTFRFSRNVMGLWLVQECRRTWARQGNDFTYDDLTKMAARADGFSAVVDPDHGEFFKPGDMPARIRKFCRTTNQDVPGTKGAVVRCALEGIALKYRWVLERMEEMLGKHLEPVHIVGGGTQNELLSQFTADATGREVVTGPIEATATGNALMQMMATGDISSWADGRQVVRDSFPLLSYEPELEDQGRWDEAYARLLQILARSGG
ncbi:MAG: rhamnulokinase family protein [Anaerolineae bacterium]|jgi:rhamnulokinase